MQQASSALAELMPSRSTSNNVKIVCGGSSIKGRRPQQEDVLLVHCDSASLSSSSQGDVVLSHGDGTGVSIVGVFDGHGGKRCSRYASQHLPENFYAALGEIRSRCQDTGHGDELVGPALRLAYRITHEDFARMARGDAESVRPKTRQRLSEALEKARSLDGLGFDANGPTVPNMPPQHRTFPQPEDTSFAAIRNRMIQQRMSLGSRVWDDGSTAITCVIRGNSALIANVGDSRAVGHISGRAVALSVDHKPNLPAERARIQNAGGTVTSMMGCHRVMGMLAMSRALGDVMIERYLSQDPDLTEQRLEDRDFIVMASDGLWDVLSNQEVVHMVATEAAKSGWSPDNLSAIANKLCLESFRRGSMDNITVVIILAVADRGRGEPHAGRGGGKADDGHHGALAHNAGSSRFRDSEMRDADSLTEFAASAAARQRPGLQRKATLGGGAGDYLRQRREAGTSVVGSVGQRLAALAGMRDRGGGGDGGSSSSNGSGAPQYGRRGQLASIPVRSSLAQSTAAGIGREMGEGRSALGEGRSSLGALPPMKRPGGVVSGLGDMWKSRNSIQKR